MERHSIIFMTDDRQRHLAGYLSGRRDTVTIEQAAEEGFCEEVVATADRILLPTPVSKLEQTAEFDTIKKYWTQQQLIFGGLFSESLRVELEKRRIAYCDLMRDEEVTVKNARITAEAVTAEIISRSRHSVEGQKIVITGFGRCAQAAAEKLYALGAQVTILARDKCARREARRRGYCAADFAYGPEEACAAQTFLNTVPAPVVTERILREMNSEILLLDIASAPGGCDREAAARYGLEVVLLPGLPSRYTTKSSAKVLADAIRKKTQLITGRKEERTWIFQILLSDTASPAPSAPSPAPDGRCSG